MKDYKEIKELFLEKEWTRDGTKFYHEQVYNNGNVYIYAIGYKKGERLWYEVFKRKVAPYTKNVDGKLVSDNDLGVVKYPSNEAFGHWARNCQTFEQAMQYAKEWSENAGT